MMADNTTRAAAALATCKRLPDYDLHAHREAMLVELIEGMVGSDESVGGLKVSYVKTPESRGNMDILTMVLASAAAVFCDEHPEKQGFAATIMCPYQVTAEQLCGMTCRRLCALGRQINSKTRCTCRVGPCKLRFTYPRDLRSIVKMGGSHLFVVYDAENIPKRSTLDVFAVLQRATRVVLLYHSDKPEYFNELAAAAVFSRKQTEAQEDDYQ